LLDAVLCPISLPPSIFRIQPLARLLRFHCRRPRPSQPLPLPFFFASLPSPHSGFLMKSFTPPSLALGISVSCQRVSRLSHPLFQIGVPTDTPHSVDRTQILCSRFGLKSITTSPPHRPPPHQSSELAQPLSLHHFRRPFPPPPPQRPGPRRLLLSPLLFKSLLHLRTVPPGPSPNVSLCSLDSKT